MHIRRIFKKVDAKRYRLRFTYDKTTKSRPAWIRVKGLPKDVHFITIHLGKKASEGKRIQQYRTYLIEGLFLPLDYTKEEIAKFYDEFSKEYNRELLKYMWNLKAAKFLTIKIKKYLLKGEMLDLGAGTGLVTEIFVKAGYSPATLVDFSRGMLQRAKKRRILKECTFIHKNTLSLNLHRTYDLVVSSFSLGSSSYFNRDDKNKLLSVINKHLKKNGILAVLGHQGKDYFKHKFKTLDAGVYILSKERKFYTDYYIGRKK